MIALQQFATAKLDTRRNRRHGPGRNDQLSLMLSVALHMTPALQSAETTPTANEVVSPAVRRP